MKRNREKARASIGHGEGVDIALGQLAVTITAFIARC